MGELRAWRVLRRSPANKFAGVPCAPQNDEQKQRQEQTKAKACPQRLKPESRNGFIRGAEAPLPTAEAVGLTKDKSKGMRVARRRYATMSHISKARCGAPAFVGFRGRGRGGRSCWWWCCLGCWSCGRRRGSGCSRTCGRGRSHPSSRGLFPWPDRWDLCGRRWCGSWG